jgi:hypothetical protein
MDPFEEWVRGAQSTCVQRYKDDLIKLGANFDSFKRDTADVIDDLVSEGIPRMAARDIYAAVSDAIAQRSAPLAVFWDIENVPIPSACTGRFAALRVKKALAEYGDLVVFRGYASIGLNNIPQEKRSELQLSGCHLVDCPHNGRKEVADKMIIVDAMEFAFERPDGAVLCFVTGDTDYAYLLSILQRRQRWRTIVISQGSLESMLHVNCSVRLRWETDILQLGTLQEQPRPDTLDASTLSVRMSRQITSDTLTPRSYATAATSGPGSQGALSLQLRANPSYPSTAEARIDVATLLRHAMRSCPEGARIGSGYLKSFVGTFLKQTYPSRFPNREVVKTFFAEAIDSGIITESGERDCKVLAFSADFGSPSTRPSTEILESTLPPVSVNDLPEDFRKAAVARPYVIFIRSSLCPRSNDLPGGTFTQVFEDWNFLMYASKPCALSAVDACPQLRFGSLVDWRKVQQRSTSVDRPVTKMPASVGVPPEASAVVHFEACSRCASSCPRAEMFVSRNGLICERCNEPAEEDSALAAEEALAKKRVCNLLDLLAENDEIYVTEDILCRTVCGKHPKECISLKQAKSWIRLAERDRLLVLYPRGNNLNVSLSRYYQEATSRFPAFDLDTSAEEAHVEDLIRRSGWWVKRTIVIESLQANFARMKNAFMRTRVLMNGYKRNRLFIGKGLHGQTVALTWEGARAALRFLVPPDQSPPQKQSDFDDGGVYVIKDSDSEEDVGCASLSVLPGTVGVGDAAFSGS